MYSFHHHRRCWPTSNQYLPLNRRLSLSLPKVLWHSLISQCTRLYDVPRTHDVGLPTQFRCNVGPASQPIAGLIPVYCLRRWPNNNPTLGLLYTCTCSTSANTWHSPNAVSMLTHSLRRWPNIGTSMGDCSVFSSIVMRWRFTPRVDI